MPRLVTKGSLRYASRDLKPGEEFEASDNDALILKGTGKAADAKPRAVAREAEPAPEAASPEVESTELFGGEQQRRGRHNRRDMRAKD
jgi:hypothetical protein